MWKSSRTSGFILIAMMAFGAFIVGTKAHRQRRILGGQNAGPNEGTFVVRISHRAGARLTGECTGTIIGRRHILTAGHCVNGSNTGTIYGGSRHRSDQTTIVNTISRVYKHPQFGTAYGGYDVGIVEVARDLDLTGRQTSALLPTSEINFDHRGFQFGWSNCDNYNQMTLQRVNVGFLRKEDCDRNGGHDQYPQLLCIDTGSAEICGGDSGGPIMSGGRVVGIGSTGANYRGQPVTSQNVYHYIDWIKSIVGQ